MSDLTEFLLARIAEDEERAEFVRRQNEGAQYAPFEPWRLSWQDEYDLLCIEPERALRECDAKRRIVEDRIHLDTVRPGAIRAHSEWVCRVLATVYSGHPDYREEWRP